MLFVPFCQNAPLCATGCHGAKGLLPNALVGIVAPHVGLLFLVGEGITGIYVALTRADADRSGEQSFCVEGVDAQRGGLICLFHDLFYLRVILQNTSCRS